MKTYSTQEKRIGTWIDGKPIYEITYSSDTATANIQIYMYDLHIETVISVQGMWKNSTGYFPINYQDATISSSVFSCYYNSHIPGLALTACVASTYMVTVQYTKTA